MKITVTVSDLVDMYNTTSRRFVRSFDELPDVVQRDYRNTYNIVGHGECEDCEWQHVPEGCNVERDSSICRLNKSMKREDGLPRIPVLAEYKITDKLLLVEPQIMRDVDGRIFGLCGNSEYNIAMVETITTKNVRDEIKTTLDNIMSKYPNFILNGYLDVREKFNPNKPKPVVETILDGSL